MTWATQWKMKQLEKKKKKRKKSTSHLFQDTVECMAPNNSTSHGCPHVTLEAISVVAQILGRLFVQGVRSVGFKE